MTQDDAVRRSFSSASRSGLSKLMLKLPSVRSELKQLSGEPLIGLFEAYDEASNMLEKLRRAEIGVTPLSLEYETICKEIEEDVLQYCLLHK